MPRFALEHLSMKENKYNDTHFFNCYSRFPRSLHGLSAAGEWHELKKLLPDFKHKRVLDVGCGFGWHANYAIENGASYVLAVDISEKMLEVARLKTTSERIEYRCQAMEDMSFSAESFDIVLSSLALHYTNDFELLCQRIYSWLKPNGNFIFSVEHPIFTAQGSQEWVCGDDGKIECWPVDRYFEEGHRVANFLGEKVIKYHRTLTTYLMQLIHTGFTLTEVVEPMPDASLLEAVPGMKDELRRPMMLLVSAKKQ